MPSTPTPAQLLYPPARGRYAARQAVESLYDVRISVVSGRPTSEQFVAAIRDEMRRRAYQPNTITEYCNCLTRFLRWLSQPPHLTQRQDVLDFLLYLADAGRSASTINGYIAAIRTAFDRMCLRQITVGIVAPRKAKRLPTVLSRKEIQNLLQATPTLREKLLLGLMYASGLRVSEVVRLKFQDIDCDRRVITVRRGKGRRDRQVVLPNTFRPLLSGLGTANRGESYVFAGNRPGRHLSTRTAQRIMKRALAIAEINKPATPHSLRHSFACHSFEDGCDIRNIQKLLGHVHLETTTIYVRVAKPTDPSRAQSPLDRLTESAQPNTSPPPITPVPPVGRLAIHTKKIEQPAQPPTYKVTLAVHGHSSTNQIFLTGIVAQEVRPGWINLQIPPLEHWEDALSQIPAAQRERIHSPHFFAMLQRQIPKYLPCPAT